MNTERLDAWHAAGAITAEQHATLTAIARRELFSVFLELNALLYLGVLAFAVGLGWTIYGRFERMGDAAVLLLLGLLLAGCFGFCFSRARPYAPDKVESPGFAFDYVLYLGSLIVGVTLGFVEIRFGLLGPNWDYHLLVSALIYAALAYRFDNRFVLSLALSTLGAWFGLRLAVLQFHIAGAQRADALAYAAVVMAAGLWTDRLELKRHFLETYLHVAANVALAALASGVIAGGDSRWLWLLGLIAASGVAIERGVRFKRFIFVVYGVLYGYVGISSRILDGLRDLTLGLAYVVVSAAAVITALAVVARRTGRDA